MIKAIVIDDEWYNLEETSELIDKTGSFQVAGKYQNPLKALEAVKAIQPQVAFIDIDLPEMDGITLAEKLLEQNSAMMIVFITSYNQYAVQAFDLNAIDYILKPIKEERFNRMVERIKNEINMRKQHTAETLKIKTFEELSVTIGELPVKWQRIKAKELFAYLLMHHGSYVHKERIIENLLPEYEPEKALQILQTSVCKIRNLFSQIKNILRLEYSSNGYCLIIEEGECDYFQVEAVLSNYKKEDPSTYDAVEKASIVFGNGFLTEEGYLWSMEKDQQLREKLLEALIEIMKTYREKNRKEETIRLLKAITKLAPFEESFNYMLMEIYQKTKNNIAAFNHYQWLEKTLLEEYDTAPSQRIKALQQELHSSY
ncbi:Two-component response regulator, SAPR family, consists of REC, wHTH and BTAD domains [Natronincola peptidivorans]|uniref:Stage 0 sporulation protein A homolog n=1 Tax=Natronincola peptidivorans TaxID=426128 RepID=A0A1I0DQN9_9FIRM|nr:response regulator [Natronincola peptidivorans]SET34566.1 Two-component response regulator, SAPR family, consists of REC, wHTH and BTAD domains [Natronincola peptidivorans]